MMALNLDPAFGLQTGTLVGGGLAPMWPVTFEIADPMVIMATLAALDVIATAPIVGASATAPSLQTCATSAAIECSTSSASLVVIQTRVQL